jgi:hypothetical protein
MAAMTRFRLTIAALLCAFLLGAASAQTPLYQQFVAFIANGQAAQPITTLDGGDNTFLSAALSPHGCVFLSYIDRDNGNRLHVVQDVGDRLEEVDLPPGAQSVAAALPQFEAPGEKQADGQLLIKPNGQGGYTLSLYYTSRVSSGGSFHLLRLDMALPTCQT